MDPETGHPPAETIVRKVSTDVQILRYLNGYLNTKRAPDENYARELQELFTLGVDSGYSETDVQESAKVLTGYRNDQSGTAASSMYSFDPTKHHTGNRIFLDFYAGKTITGHSGTDGRYFHYPSREKIFYYRIKSLGPGNQETFSNTVVKRPATLSLSVYPIPAVHFINVKMNHLEENKAYLLRLVSITGAQVWQSNEQSGEFSASVYRIPVSNLGPGTYVLHVQDEAGLASNQKIMIAGK